MRWPISASTQRKAECSMCSAFRSFRALLFLTSALLTAAPLRVCSDPNNMPFSNRAQQGFENKIADLLAANMHVDVEYTWWVQRKNFAKRSLDSGACDLVIGIPSDVQDVLTTEPYYRSTYVFV